MTENRKAGHRCDWGEKGNGRLCPGFIHLEKRKGMQNRNIIITEDWLLESDATSALFLFFFFFPLSNLTERENVSNSVVSNSSWPVDYSPPGYSPWNSPGKNTGVSSHSFLQEIFPTQGLNLHLLHCWQFLYSLSHYEIPNLTESVPT